MGKVLFCLTCRVRGVGRAEQMEVKGKKKGSAPDFKNRHLEADCRPVCASFAVQVFPVHFHISRAEAPADKHRLRYVTDIR